MLFHLENDLFALGSIERYRLSPPLLRGWDYRFKWRKARNRLVSVGSMEMGAGCPLHYVAAMRSQVESMAWHQRRQAR